MEQLVWESGTPVIAGSAGTNYSINTLKLKLKQNCPLRDNKVVIDGTYCFHKSDSNGSLVVLDGSKKITVIVRPKGVSVSGTVTSYGDAGENVTVHLIEAGHTEPSYEAIVPGNSAAYSFATVPAGTYTLKVMKKGHATRLIPLTVESVDITDKNVTIYLMGDLDENGVVDVDDVLACLNLCFGTPTADDIRKADIDGSGVIDVDDVLACLNLCF